MIATIFAADLIFAQIAKRIIPEWRDATANASYHISHPVYHHGLAPNVESVAVFGRISARYVTNSLGFRDKAPRQAEPGRAAKRIFVFDGSFTEGANFELDDTVVGTIAAAVANDGYEVLNASLASYAPSIYYTKFRHLLETQGVQVSETEVFLDLFDIFDEAKCYYLKPNETVGNRSGLDARPMKRFKKILAEYSLICHTYWVFKDGGKEKNRRCVGHFEAATNWDRARWTTDPSLRVKIGMPGLRQSRARLDDMKALADEHGVAMALVVYPWPDQIAEKDEDSLQVRYWKDWAEASGVRFYSLFAPFFTRDLREVIDAYFIPFDFHYNVAGHAVIARDFLRQWRPADTTNGT